MGSLPTFDEVKPSATTPSDGSADTETKTPRTAAREEDLRVRDEIEAVLQSMKEDYERRQKLWMAGYIHLFFLLVVLAFFRILLLSLRAYVLPLSLCASV